jgi:hypothetical protein
MCYVRAHDGTHYGYSLATNKIVGSLKLLTPPGIRRQQRFCLYKSCTLIVRKTPEEAEIE